MYDTQAIGSLTCTDGNVRRVVAFRKNNFQCFRAKLVFANTALLRAVKILPDLLEKNL